MMSSSSFTYLFLDCPTGSHWSTNLSDLRLFFFVRRNDFSTRQDTVEVEKIILTCPEVPGRVHRCTHRQKSVRLS